MAYPANDTEFTEQKIKSVKSVEAGWSITMEDGWSFYIRAEHGVEPKPGMTIRQYGKGIGFPIRGVYLDGELVYYQSENDHREQSERDMYGADAADWLSRWDSGETVHTIEMGGLGPGYEQCIHITAAEILRFMLDNKLDADSWSDAEAWEADREKMDTHLFGLDLISSMGLSGAQVGAAYNLAVMLYKRGPIAVMKDDRVKDRHIMVSKSFPAAA